MHALRTIIATLLGSSIGALAVGYGSGTISSTIGDIEGLAAAGIAVIGAGVGAVLGAAVALWIAFRQSPTPDRLITLAAVVIAGPALFAAIAFGLAQVDPALSLPPLYLALALAAAALLGRWFATRHTHPQEQDQSPTFQLDDQQNDER